MARPPRPALVPLDGGDSPRTLPDYVIEHLTEAMFGGRLNPGERLSPMKLAAELGVSHIPVREALSTLEASGHVIRMPRRGYFVAPLSVEDVEDVYRWRRVLEEEANRIGIPLLGEDELARMRELNTRMREAESRGDRAEFGALNREWHFIPVRLVNSQHIERFLAHLWDAASRYQATLLQGVDFLSEVQHQHESLLDAYERRDVEAVNRLLDEHRQTTLDAVRRALTKADEAGGS